MTTWRRPPTHMPFFQEGLDDWGLLSREPCVSASLAERRKEYLLSTPSESCAAAARVQDAFRHQMEDRLDRTMLSRCMVRSRRKAKLELIRTLFGDPSSDGEDTLDQGQAGQCPTPAQDVASQGRLPASPYALDDSSAPA